MMAPIQPPAKGVGQEQSPSLLRVLCFGGARLLAFAILKDLTGLKL